MEFTRSILLINIEFINIYIYKYNFTEKGSTWCKSKSHGDRKQLKHMVQIATWWPYPNF